jgi:hypothetical protein
VGVRRSVFALLLFTYPIKELVGGGGGAMSPEPSSPHSALSYKPESAI